MTGKHVRLVMDNVTEVFYVNNKEGTVDPFTVMNLHEPFGCGEKTGICG